MSFLRTLTLLIKKLVPNAFYLLKCLSGVAIITLTLSIGFALKIPSTLRSALAARRFGPPMPDHQ